MPPKTENEKIAERLSKRAATGNANVNPAAKPKGVRERIAERGRKVVEAIPKTKDQAVQAIKNVGVRAAPAFEGAGAITGQTARTTAGLGSTFVQGAARTATGRQAPPGSAAPGGERRSRAQRVAESRGRTGRGVPSGGGGGAGGGLRGSGTPEDPFRDPNRKAPPGRGKKVLTKAGRALPGVAAVGIGLEAAEKGTTTEGRDLLQRQSGLGEQPIVAENVSQEPRRQRLQEANQADELGALFGEPEAGTDPINLNALQASGRTVLGTIRGGLGFPAEDEAAEIGEPLQTRSPFDPDNPGVRLFTNEDARNAAQGLTPASRRGTASLEQNQEVLDRLLARNAEQRQQGLRNAAAAGAGAGAGAGLQERTLDRLASQARGGGLASAFGALRVGGNLLRKEAADRTRAARAAEANREFGRDVALQQLRNQPQLAANEAAAQQQAFENANTLTEQRRNLIAEGRPEEVEAFDNRIFSDALQGVPGAGQVASGIVGQELEALRQDRGAFQRVAEFFSGVNTQPLGPDAGFAVSVNPNNGRIQVLNDNGKLQPIGNLSDLSPQTANFLRDTAAFVDAEGNVTKPAGIRDKTRIGEGAIDPNLRGVRDF